MGEASDERERLSTVGAAVTLTVLLSAAGSVRPAVAQELPSGVSQDMVKQGRAIYLEDGFCYTCHGRDGRGVPDLGSDLSDGRWNHTDGSYGSLMDRIRNGITANVSSAGVPMPPAGGAKLDRNQIRAVAAYVWILSRGGG